MNFLGTSSDVHVCDDCGKGSLKRTFVLENDDGEVFHYGADCAAKALGLSGTPRALAHQLRMKLRYRGTRAAPALKNRDEIPAVIEGEIDSAVAHAKKAGAHGTLTFVGAGMTGIVLTDGKRAYKVARHGDALDTVAEEAEWLEAAAQTPFVRDHVPKHVAWDAENRVLVRDMVKGRPGRWSEESKLHDLHKKIEEHMIPAGWTAPEFKGDSYIMTEDGPILIDGSMPSRVGDGLVKYVEDVVDGRRQSKEKLDDLAFYLRREIIAKHNPRGTVAREDVMRLLDKLEAKGAKFDPSWRD